MFSFADFIETFALGCIGTAFLSVIGFIIWGIVSYPLYIAFTAILVLLIYTVGLFIKNLDLIIDALERKPTKTTSLPSQKEYGIPVLDGLEKFEKKYGLSTVRFMSFVANEWIPKGMNNLDYLEWISLAGQLPSVTYHKKKGGK